MGQLAVAYVKARKSPEQNPKEDPPLSSDEKRAYAKMLKESKDHGATLANEGKGGLPPSTVLGILRRDKFECKKCGGKKNLSIHHKGHLENPKSRWLAKKGRDNDPANIVVVCEDCHDQIHQEDREDSND